MYVRRRDFLQGSLLSAAAIGAGTACRAGAAEEATSDEARSDGPGPIVDAHVNLSRWPFRRIPGDEPAELVGLLRAQGVVEAWAGSFDGVFHKDVGGVNARLADQCRTYGDGLLVPFGTVNPKMPDWEEDLRRCDEEYAMPGIRLHPNYHGYTLDDPALARLLRLAAERGMIVQLVAWMEDVRHQNPLMPVPEVDLAPLPAVLGDLPELALVLLNAVHVPWSRHLPPLLKRPKVFFDLARLELIEGLAKLLKRVPADRLLFGSFSPMFYFESTLLKLRESAIDGADARKMLAENARGLLAASRGKEARP